MNLMCSTFCRMISESAMTELLLLLRPKPHKSVQSFAANPKSHHLCSYTCAKQKTSRGRAMLSWAAAVKGPLLKWRHSSSAVVVSRFICPEGQPSDGQSSQDMLLWTRLPSIQTLKGSKEDNARGKLSIGRICHRLVLSVLDWLSVEIPATRHFQTILQSPIVAHKNLYMYYIYLLWGPKENQVLLINI